MLSSSSGNPPAPAPAEASRPAPAVDPARVVALERRVRELEAKVDELAAIALAAMTGAFDVERVDARRPAPMGASDSAIPEEHLVLISAAVAAALGASARIRGIRRVSLLAHDSQWKRRGRELQFASHRFGGRGWR